jgi:hypothetical protein
MRSAASGGFDGLLQMTRRLSRSPKKKANARQRAVNEIAATVTKQGRSVL